MTKSNDNTGLKMTLNTSGIIPLDLRVLVLPDTVEEKVGNIFIPESAKEKEEWATVKATLIAVGENAFAEAKRNPDFNAPKAGSRVIIAKYAGGNANLTGKDGVKYRIMNDEDIIAGLED